MQRQTIRTLLLIVLAVGMLVAVADPVAALNDQSATTLTSGEGATANVCQLNVQESDQAVEILALGDGSDIVVLTAPAGTYPVK